MIEFSLKTNKQKRNLFHCANQSRLQNFTFKTVSHLRLESQGFPSVSYEMDYCWFRRADFPTAFSVVQRG